MKKIILLSGIILCSVVATAGEVLLRFGAISDNHLDRTRPATFQRTKQAFELFKKHNVDFFVDCGDVADTYQPDMFQLWRRLYSEVFSDAGTRPDFLMIPAGHDRIGTTWEQGYGDFVKLTGSGTVNPVKCIKGFHFVSIAQKEKPDILKQNLANAATGSPAGTPIFVITHYPPMNTTPGTSSASGGDKNYRAILNNYPQAVVISGHTHTRLMDERAIWQGEFTAVNAGTLAYTDNAGIANATERCYSYDASIWEVYKNKIVIRRFNVADGREMYPDSPWEIPLPFQKKNAPYSRENRMKNFPVPEFNQETAVTFHPVRHSWDRWGTLNFPSPENSRSLNRYRLVLEKCNSDGQYDHHGIIEFVRNKAAGKMECLSFSAGYLEPANYRFTLTPVNYFGRSGTPAHGKFKVRKVPWKEIKNDYVPVVFSGRKEGQKLTPDSEGFFSAASDFRLVLPHEIIERSIQDKKKLIISIGIECIGAGNPARLRIVNGSGRIVTLDSICFRESAQRQQYTAVFRPSNLQNYSLLIRNGDPGKYRFSNIRFYLY
ncbi:MAG TPA: hypothetical protein DE060_19645 [Lentisphaeria bacterium]|nr:hypothetical protein [Lentisphaeria bacterium]HCG51403.1 hypothetical protein [Lentisphaeria bacterium]